MDNRVKNIDLYFRSGNNVEVTIAAIHIDEWKAVLEYIEQLKERISDYGWAESARHAELTGGTL